MALVRPGPLLPLVVFVDGRGGGRVVLRGFNGIRVPILNDENIQRKQKNHQERSSETTLRNRRSGRKIVELQYI